MARRIRNNPPARDGISNLLGNLAQAIQDKARDKSRAAEQITGAILKAVGEQGEAILELPPIAPPAISSAEQVGMVVCWDDSITPPRIITRVAGSLRPTLRHTIRRRFTNGCPGK